jgi:hypothetical protein
MKTSLRSEDLSFSQGFYGVFDATISEDSDSVCLSVFSVIVGEGLYKRF